MNSNALFSKIYQQGCLGLFDDDGDEDSGTMKYLYIYIFIDIILYL